MKCLARSSVALTQVKMCAQWLLADGRGLTYVPTPLCVAMSRPCGCGTVHCVPFDWLCDGCFGLGCYQLQAATHLSQPTCDQRGAGGGVEAGEMGARAGGGGERLREGAVELLFFCFAFLTRAMSCVRWWLWLWWHSTRI